MTKYVKLIDNTIQEAPKNKDGICNYNLDVELMLQDGYKEFIEIERPQTNRFYHIEYVENSDNISETIVYEETQEEADLRELSQAKQTKIQENDVKRDIALNQGVEYKGVLFDSDTDQKVNLLAMVSTMTGEETMYWYGKDNTPLLCDKEDLTNLGYLIAQLHTFCWTKNAQIKQAINEAQTVEELDEIEIDYSIIID